MKNISVFYTGFVLLTGWSFANGPEPLSKEDRKWIDEEVVYICARQEREEFLSLETSRQRKEFIRNFWRLRDPNPATEVNEFREEHYRRIQYANDRFNEGIPGWKTDRGRIYIRRGPPDDLHYSFGGDPLRISIQNPTEYLTGGNPDRRRLYVLEFHRPESEIWTYRHLDGARNISGYFQVIFAKADASRLQQLRHVLEKLGDSPNMSRPSRLARDAEIMNFLNGRRIGGDFEIVYAGEYEYSTIDDYYLGIFHPGQFPTFSPSDFHLALADLERSPGDVLFERLERKRKLREAVESRVSYDSFPVQLTFGAVRSASGGTLLPISVGLASSSTRDILEIAIELIRNDGTTAAAVVDRVETGSLKQHDPSSGKDQFLYQARLAARPGAYRLLVYGRLQEKEAVTFLEREVELPDFSNQSLSLSQVLLFDRVVPRSEFEKSRRQLNGSKRPAGSEPLFVKDMVLLPDLDGRFRKEEKLTALFEIYNPALSEPENRPNLDLDCRLRRNGVAIVQLPRRHLDYLTSGASGSEGENRTSYGLSIPLSSLANGSYILEVEVRDRISGQKVVEQVDFSVY